VKVQLRICSLRDTDKFADANLMLTVPLRPAGDDSHAPRGGAAGERNGRSHRGHPRQFCE
jgi:hypothetical protein